MKNLQELIDSLALAKLPWQISTCQGGYVATVMDATSGPAPCLNATDALVKAAFPFRKFLPPAIYSDAADERPRANTAEDVRVMLDDLGHLLEALGLPNVARPESPHFVMQECISEVGRLRDLLLARTEALEAALDDAGMR
jgi:hypothetical protein